MSKDLKISNEQLINTIVDYQRIRTKCVKILHWKNKHGQSNFGENFELTITNIYLKSNDTLSVITKNKKYYDIPFSEITSEDWKVDFIKKVKEIENKKNKTFEQTTTPYYVKFKCDCGFIGVVDFLKKAPRDKRYEIISRASAKNKYDVVMCPNCYEEHKMKIDIPKIITSKTYNIVDK